MAVVKGGNFVYTGAVDIKNKIAKVDKKSKNHNITDYNDSPTEDLVKMKQHYIAEGMKIIEEANSKAEAILQRAKIEAKTLTDTAKEQSGNLRHTAQTEGYNSGYSDGFEKGYNEGVEECREYLESSKILLEEIGEKRERIFIKYENDIFDTALAIANKITMDSITPKDSRVIAKIIKQAAKGFRNSQFLTISLCKNQANVQLATDQEFLAEISASIPHVEIELLQDAEEGTIILDNGNEITDASLSTQLKMIEELGKGKYKSPQLDSEEE